MSAMTNFLENALIDHVLRGTPYTAPGTVYFALFTDATADDGSGTEVSGGSYARVGLSTVLATGNFSGTSGGSPTAVSSGTDGTTTNKVAVTFPSPTANWGTVTNVAIFDASSGGNMLFHGTLGASKIVNNGDDAPEFEIDAFSLQIDD